MDIWCVNKYIYIYTHTLILISIPYIYTAYATQGPGSNGAAVTFTTSDWKTWRRNEKPLTYSNTSGGWECPDFFLLPESQQSDGITHVAKASKQGKDWWAS